MNNNDIAKFMRRMYGYVVRTNPSPVIDISSPEARLQKGLQPIISRGMGKKSIAPASKIVTAREKELSGRAKAQLAEHMRAHNLLMQGKILDGNKEVDISKLIAHPHVVPEGRVIPPGKPYSDPNHPNHHIAITTDMGYLLHDPKNPTAAPVDLFQHGLKVTTPSGKSPVFEAPDLRVQKVKEDQIRDQIAAVLKTSQIHGWATPRRLTPVFEGAERYDPTNEAHQEAKRQATRSAIAFFDAKKASIKSGEDPIAANVAAMQQSASAPKRTRPKKTAAAVAEESPAPDPVVERPARRPRAPKRPAAEGDAPVSTRRKLEGLPVEERRALLNPIKAAQARARRRLANPDLDKPRDAKPEPPAISADSKRWEAKGNKHLMVPRFRDHPAMKNALHSGDLAYDHIQGLKDQMDDPEGSKYLTDDDKYTVAVYEALHDSQRYASLPVKYRTPLLREYNKQRQEWEKEVRKGSQRKNYQPPMPPLMEDGAYRLHPEIRSILRGEHPLVPVAKPKKSRKPSVRDAKAIAQKYKEFSGEK